MPGRVEVLCHDLDAIVAAKGMGAGMDVVVLTAICLVGLGLAALIALRWGALRIKRGSALCKPARPGRMVQRFLRAVAVGMVAGAPAGVFVLGLGGRLAMRILAATSGNGAQGLLTDAEERVGEITLGGTLGVVLFIGLFGGIIGGVAYMAVRRWLPGRAWVAGLLAGMVALPVLRLDPLDPDSVDFDILRPLWLAVTLFLLLIPLFGVVVASLAERLDRTYPVLSARPRALVAYLPLVLLLLVPPAVVVLALGALVAAISSAVGPIARVWRTPAVERGGQALLTVAGGAGLLWLGAGVASIR